MSAAGRATMVGMLDKMSKSKSWQDTLKKQGWDDAYLSGDAFGGFLKEENVRIAAGAQGGRTGQVARPLR